ncbi:MAG: hypothetical protein OSB62_01520 [Alphaproteobacteria bacterium]|nr:hypothetical protein [Alphaproteobacteria bacterium]
MDHDALQSLLEQACDPRTDEATRRNTQNLIAKRYPEELDKILTGKLQDVVEPQLYQAATEPKPKVVVKTVPPKNYEGLIRMATELTRMKIQALKNGIADYGNRFMRVTEVRAHLDVLDKKPEDFNITQATLDSWEAPPPPKQDPNASFAQRAYQRIKGIASGKSTIDHTA